MKTKLPDGTTGPQVLKPIAPNLFRSEQSGIFHGIFKRKGRQVKRSLRTTNEDLARRRLEELHRKVEQLAGENIKNLPFAEYDDKGELVGGLAKRWLDLTGAAVEASTRDRYLDNIKQLSPHFQGLTAARISWDEIEEWSKTRATKRSANTYNWETNIRIMPFTNHLPNYEGLTKAGDEASEGRIMHENVTGTPPKTSPTELIRRRADGKRFPIKPHLDGHKTFIPSANAATGTTSTRATRG